jgi:hypothetical protein
MQCKRHSWQVVGLESPRLDDNGALPAALSLQLTLIQPGRQGPDALKTRYW